MRHLLLACLFAVPASAQTGLPAFEFTSAAQLRAMNEQRAAIAAPAAVPADVITSGHMLLQAGKDVLFGYADTKEQFEEAAARWSSALRAAGVTPGVPEWKDKLFTLPYKTADGRVIRAFRADPMQFPPKDDAGLRANMALAQSALRAAGLTPVASNVVNLEYLLPTYSILYLVKPEASREKETQLRVLKPGDDLDPGLIAKSGVTVVQTPKPWILVYVGAELGCVGFIAKTREDIEARLAKRTAYLVEQGKRIVGSKIVAFDDPDYKFAAELLFFQ
ncbi:MAG: hypothetical protein M0D55_01085 [Elusimicrobiota bacterium]|nr:MAG: hypothetical protein M0D55_01085 [Elusimicrobiota bacterium]